MHTGFFGPTRDASWADNWDGELDDLLASLQGQVASFNKYRYFTNNWYMNAACACLSKGFGVIVIDVSRPHRDPSPNPNKASMHGTALQAGVVLPLDGLYAAAAAAAAEDEDEPPPPPPPPQSPYGTRDEELQGLWEVRRHPCTAAASFLPPAMH